MESVYAIQGATSGICESDAKEVLTDHHHDEGAGSAGGAGASREHRSGSMIGAGLGLDDGGKGVLSMLMMSLNEDDGEEEEDDTGHSEFSEEPWEREEGGGDYDDGSSSGYEPGLYSPSRGTTPV